MSQDQEPRRATEAELETGVWAEARAFLREHYGRGVRGERAMHARALCPRCGLWRTLSYVGNFIAHGTERRLGAPRCEGSGTKP